jgi:hypothetical protein
MWLYRGPSCPNHSSFEELSVVEIDARIHKVLDLRIKLNPRACPTTLQGGVASARICTLGLVLIAFMILSFHYTLDLE